MATLYVENIPRDLYEALRGRARSRRRSIAAEVLALLEANVPTEKELKTRLQFFHRIRQMQSRRPLKKKMFPATEEMLRGDRDR
jgi:plasmid stability protein